MWPYKVVEKDKHADQIIGRVKRFKSLLSLVPSLELMMKRLNKIVGDIILKTLNSDMFNIRSKHRLSRYLVSAVTVTDNGRNLSRCLTALKIVKA